MEMSLSQNDDQCKTWEEEMYWKHFHAMHFYIVLPKDFHHHLVLPSKFAEHVSSNLPNKVSLIGPSSSSWDVEVSKAGKKVSLVGDGWKDFAKAYNLEENLMMVFKYKQNSSFEALIFDKKNMCEKESSYFVKKSLPRLENKIDRKRSVGDIASTELLGDNDDVGRFECVYSKKPKKDIAETPRTIPTDEEFSEDNDDDDYDDDDDDPEFIMSDKAIDDFIVEVVGSKSCLSNEVVTKERGGPSEATKTKAQAARKPGEDITARELYQLNGVEQTPTENEERDVHEKVVSSAVNKCNATSEDALSVEVMNGDSLPTTNNTRKPGGKRGRPGRRSLSNSVRKLVFKSGSKRLSKEYVSHRRPVTSEEMEDALRRANEALPEGGFIVMMRPTGVYKRFYLSIPAEWVSKNLPNRHKEVILRVGEKTWVTMFHYYGRRGHTGGLATGWKNFAIQNNLEDSDVCVFKPATKKDDATLILDVEIFRVVQEITPLTPLICSV
ncbi:B3 domain-containing protein REM16-like [Silene latifolia]|uniref:B3 domain-containing protein REM16-like n=1 Tax=Silene latifolia TaxID=37657 RepID=UPI003D77BAF8